MIDIGTLGGKNSWAKAINNSGVIVGVSAERNVKRGLAFSWKNGHLNAINSGTRSASATAINDSGIIAGAYTDRNGHYYTCVWNHGMLRTLPGQSGYGGEAMGIDEKGNVCGSECMRVFGPGRACVWINGRLRLLKVPGNTDSSRANSISGTGTVVGFIETSSMNLPYIWNLNDDSGAILQHGAGSATADSFNSDGVFVGSQYKNGTSSAVEWINGHLKDLNTLTISSRNWTLLGATGINSTGQICGFGIHDGHRHAFVLTPIQN